MNVAAFDLGGSRLKTGVVRDGNLDDVRILDASLDLVVADGPVDGAGLCVPGLVTDDGVVASLPGKLAGIEGTDLLALLRERFGARAVVTNDAVAYAVGESVAGAGRGIDRVVVVTIGTGVGVTVIERGAPVTRGLVGAGILGGFIPISDRTDGPVDSIGRADTIEALCRADRIGDNIPALYEAVALGDATGRAQITTYRTSLTRALTALASAHAPDLIILGGGPMTPDNPITPGIADEVNERMFGSYRVAITTAALGDGAALLGLAHMVENL